MVEVINKTKVLNKRNHNFEKANLKYPQWMQALYDSLKESEWQDELFYDSDEFEGAFIERIDWEDSEEATELVNKLFDDGYNVYGDPVCEGSDMIGIIAFKVK